MNENQCEFISPRGRIRCELKAGHEGRHRAWDKNGIPTLVMDVPMPDGLSSVAREAAEREADRQYPELRFAPENEQRADDFISGFTECASRLPSEEDLADALRAEDIRQWEEMNPGKSSGSAVRFGHHTRPKYKRHARAVLALIRDSLTV